MARIYPRLPFAEKFWRHVSPEPNTGCWLWDRPGDKDGYGKVSRMEWDGPGERRAHRVSWVMHNGPIPPGMFVCHRCDNPACVNPDHLFVGSLQDNVDDMVKKGRRTVTRIFGEASPVAKFTEAQVKIIRDRYAAGEGLRAMAREYGVHHTTLMDMVHRKTWPLVA